MVLTTQSCTSASTAFSALLWMTFMATVQCMQQFCQGAAQHGFNTALFRFSCMSGSSARSCYYTQMQHNKYMQHIRFVTTNRLQLGHWVRHVRSL